MPPGSGQSFEARGDVHSIPENVPILDDDIAHIDPDSNLNPGPRSGVSLRHSLLHFHRTAQGINHAPELNEQTVASRLHQPAMMLVDFRIYDFGSNRSRRSENQRADRKSN